MIKTALLPIDDFVFKHIFGNRKNTGILADFLKAVLGLPDTELDHLAIVDPFLNRFRRQDKTGILDVLIHTASGRVINVEIQVAPFKTMRQRILFYSSRLVWDQMHRGGDYGELKQTVSIVICDHILLPEEPDYRNCYHLRNKHGREFTNLLEIVILELPKVPKDRDGNALWSWLKFLKCKNREECTMLAEQNPEVRKVVGVYKKLTWGERRQLINLAREKTRLTRQAIEISRYEEGMEKGIEQGEKKGLEEGSRQEKLEIARKMKSRGRPFPEIAEDTGLSLEDINSL